MHRLQKAAEPGRAVKPVALRLQARRRLHPPDRLDRRREAAGQTRQNHRAQVLAAASAAHPDAFVRRLRTLAALQKAAWINPPKLLGPAADESLSKLGPARVSNSLTGSTP